MYENDNSILNNEANFQINQETNCETTQETVQEANCETNHEVRYEAAHEANCEMSQETNREANYEAAYVTNSAAERSASVEHIVIADTASAGQAYTEASGSIPQSENGRFSGSVSGQIPQQGASGSQPYYSAKDIQPRKKMGWGKRIVVLVLCGLLLGSTTAGAYFGVTQLLNRFKPTLQQEQTIPSEAGQEVTKEPEISKAEIIAPVQSDNVQSGNAAVGVVYDVSAVVENVMPAMVSIINKYTQTISGFFGQSYTQEGASSGSGIIIGENATELLIATNYHVVEGSDSIEITFIDGTVGEAFIKGTNPDMDLAVVSVVLETLSPETKAAIAVAQLGNSDGLRLGQPVIAIGNALGYGQSVTTGVVSAVDRQISVEEGANAGSFIQTDAAINPGNSGGALLNMSGEVIGINSNKIGGSAIEGMGYAIPISAAEPIISDLSLQTTKVKVEESKRGYLGVSVAEVTASDTQRYGMPQGVYIGEFTEGSPAKAGGMELRDIIVGFDTFKVQSYADLQDAMQYFAEGTTVRVEVKRVQNGDYVSVFLEITLGERPAE